MAESPMSLPAALGLLLVLIAFSLGVFYVMLFIFAQLTGWRTLARRYRGTIGPTPLHGEAVIGVYAWNSPPLSVGVDERGISLLPYRPFRPIFGELRIPWSEVV